jgi:hypothetical protein
VGNARSLLYGDRADEPALRRHLEAALAAPGGGGPTREDVEGALAGFRLEARAEAREARFRRPARCRMTLRQLMAVPEVLAGGLRVEEALAAHAFTGPLAQARALPSRLRRMTQRTIPPPMQRAQRVRLLRQHPCSRGRRPRAAPRAR